jgi:hypothetical protein
VLWVAAADRQIAADILEKFDLAYAPDFVED